MRQIAPYSGSDGETGLCLVDSAGLRIDCRHFINGQNVTDLVSEGKAAMILVETSVWSR